MPSNSELHSPGSSNQLPSSNPSSKPEPAHTKYISTSAFLDHARATLAKRLPKDHEFHKRLLSCDTGQLQPIQPRGRPRTAFGSSSAIPRKTKSARSEPSDPVFVLERNQLINMWNTEWRSKEAITQYRRAVPTMSGKKRKYKLVECKEAPSVLKETSTSKKRLKSNDTKRGDNDGGKISKHDSNVLDSIRNATVTETQPEKEQPVAQVLPSIETSFINDTASSSAAINPPLFVAETDIHRSAVGEDIHRRTISSNAENASERHCSSNDKEEGEISEDNNAKDERPQDTTKACHPQGWSYAFDPRLLCSFTERYQY